jgi:hypothetical protein
MLIIGLFNIEYVKHEHPQVAARYCLVWRFNTLETRYLSCSFLRTFRYARAICAHMSLDLSGDTQQTG